MNPILINGKWPLLLLDHRAERPEWPWWEAHTLAVARHLIREGTVVWDVGSEEGDFPALWGTWGAQVVMVEPNPYVWPQIKLHWQANVPDDPLACIVGLASNVDEEATPDYPAGYNGVWPVCADGPIHPEHGFRNIWEHPTVSPQHRLDSLGLAAPDLVMMDIEGGEWHALTGMEETLRTHHPQLVVSIHDAFLQDLYGLTAEDVYRFLGGLDYEARHFCRDHEAHVWFS